MRETRIGFLVDWSAEPAACFLADEATQSEYYKTKRQPVSPWSSGVVVSALAFDQRSQSTSGPVST